MPNPERFPIGRVGSRYRCDASPNPVIAHTSKRYIRTFAARTHAPKTRTSMLARIATSTHKRHVLLSRQTGDFPSTPTAIRKTFQRPLAIEFLRTSSLDSLFAGMACLLSRITLADCALVPGLFFVETVMPAAGVDSPIPDLQMSPHMGAVQKNEHAQSVIRACRGVAERRE